LMTVSLQTWKSRSPADVCAVAVATVKTRQMKSDEVNFSAVLVFSTILWAATWRNKSGMLTQY